MGKFTFPSEVLSDLVPTRFLSWLNPLEGVWVAQCGAFINLQVVPSGGIISWLNPPEGVQVEHSGGFSVYAPVEVLDETIYLKRGKFALPSGGFINLVTSGGFTSWLNPEGVWVAHSGGFSLYMPAGVLAETNYL